MELQRILAVDDSRVITHLVKVTLEREGYEVWTANSGEEALQLLKKKGLPHLAVVDINMPPGMNGFEFCRRMHRFSDVPVIMLSGEHDEEIVSRGLDLYAEDYMIKSDPGPLRTTELISRVRRVLRRVGDFAYTLDPTIVVDDRVRINFPERKLHVQDDVVSLTPTEAKLLYVLMRNAGRTVSNEYLLQRVWPLDEAYEDRLHSHIYRLRKKIENDPKKPYYVVSDWGHGYSFPPTGVAVH